MLPFLLFLSCAPSALAFSFANGIPAQAASQCSPITVHYTDAADFAAATSTLMSSVSICGIQTTTSSVIAMTPTPTPAPAPQFPFTCASSDTSILIDAGFECPPPKYEEDDPWQSDYSGQAEYGRVIDATRAHSGSAFYKLKSSSDTEPYHDIYLTQHVKTPLHKQVVFTFWAKVNTPETNPSCSFTVRLRQAQPSPYSDSHSWHGGAHDGLPGDFTTGWTQYTYNFSPPTYYDGFYLVWDTCDSTLFLDDITISYV